MGTFFAPTFANLTMGYHEIKGYSITHQSYAFATKYFEKFWFRFSDDCQILQLLSNIQLTVEKSQARLPSLDKIIKQVQKSGWISTTNQQTENDMSHLH